MVMVAVMVMLVAVPVAVEEEQGHGAAAWPGSWLTFSLLCVICHFQMAALCQGPLRPLKRQD